MKKLGRRAIVNADTIHSVSDEMHREVGEDLTWQMIGVPHQGGVVRRYNWRTEKFERFVLLAPAGPVQRAVGTGWDDFLFGRQTYRMRQSWQGAYVGSQRHLTR